MARRLIEDPQTTASGALQNWYPTSDAKAIKKLARSSKLRARFWGVILSLATDGVTSFEYQRDPNTTQLLKGEPVPLAKPMRLAEKGPLIVVANHSSLADTALLLATLGRTGRPVLLAAPADYWLSNPVNKFIARHLAGLWPVRKDEREDLCKAANLIRNGAILVIFPEGTPTTDGSLGQFHDAAYVLALETGARVLPVALLNTARTLPVRGRFRRAHLEVRCGPAYFVGKDEIPAIIEKQREDIQLLLKEPASPHPGFGWSRVSRIAGSWVGLVVVFFWAFGEGVSWPLLAEMPLMLLVVTVGRSWRGALLIAASATGSLLGILTTWYLVSHGHIPPTPLTTPRMRATALQQMTSDPTTAFWHQTYNGIPVKLYAHASGLVRLSFKNLLISAAPRIARIFVVGGFVWAFGGLVSRYLKPCLGLVQSLCLLVFPFALYGVIRLWS